MMEHGKTYIFFLNTQFSDWRMPNKPRGHWIY
jgi:hypothetical protein